MPEDILINFTPQETRVAVMYQGAVQELHIERNASRGLVGNVYVGRIVRILPGMQSAFITEPSVASTQKLPLPCISTAVYSSGRLDASSTSSLRITSTMPIL